MFRVGDIVRPTVVCNHWYNNIGMGSTWLEEILSTKQTYFIEKECTFSNNTQFVWIKGYPWRSDNFELIKPMSLPYNPKQQPDGEGDL